MADAAQGLRAVLGETVFARYVAGNAVSLVGSWTQRVAVGWLAWELEGSPFWLGIVAFADLFPTLLVGPFGGLLADRLEQRGILLATQSLLALQSLALAVLTLTGQMSISVLTGMSATQGLLVGVNQPARLAYIPTLVTRERLASAVAVNSVVFNTARIAGPAVGGLLIAGSGTAAAFFANTASYLVFILVLLRLPLARPPVRARAGWFTELREGVALVAGRGALAPVFAMVVAASVLVRPVAEFLPALAAGVYGGGAGAFATLTAALGAGAVIGGLWLAAHPPEDELSALFAAQFAGATTLLLLLASPGLWYAVAAALLCGAAFAGTGVTAQSLLQKRVPVDFRGRVLALYGLSMRSGPAIGALLAGTLAEGLGLRITLAAGGLLDLLLVGLLLRRRRQLGRRLETLAPSTD